MLGRKKLDFNELKQIPEDIERIQKKFLEGFTVVLGLVNNKKEVFLALAEEKRKNSSTSLKLKAFLKKTFSDSITENKNALELSKQLRNIISNQEVLLKFYHEESIPSMLASIERLLNDFNLKQIHEIKVFLVSFKKALAHLDKQIVKDFKILETQKTLIGDNKRFYSHFINEIDKEERLIGNFLLKTRNMKISQFEGYASQLKNEAELARSGRIKILKTGLLFSLFGAVAGGAVGESAKLIADFIRPEDAPDRLNIVLFISPALGAMIAMARGMAYRYDALKKKA